MNNKERFQAVRERREPDYMPVWPLNLSQMIFGNGYLLPDVTGQDWLNSEKCTEAVLSNIKNIGYDLAIPAYIDFAFGVSPLGGVFNIPDKAGVGVRDIKTADPRMKSTLEVIKNVSNAIGDTTPLSAIHFIGTTAAMFLFRENSAFMEDMNEDPEWVDEMCKVASDFAMNWIRAQYEAGANSVTWIVETFGTLMMSPKMHERFNFPHICDVVEMVKKEFNQGVWIHIHGDMKDPENYKYFTKLVTETGIEGFHLDEAHPADWIKENVVDKLGVSACIVVENHKLVSGPVEEIRDEVKNQISKIGDGLGIMMAPSCQILPATPNEHFKAWVDAVHEYGKYPIG
jgi:uroporphyrinogen-III decarboxylase